MSDPTIRPATLADLPGLTDIYNHYVRETAITFDIEEFTPETRRPWFDHHADTGRHRCLVAQQDGRVLGYASTGPWRPKRAYETSVEVSIYLSPDATGHGLGSALYTELFAAIDGEDLHRAMAGITMPNEASIALHKKFGFKQVARFTENGRKFGRFWDVVWMERPL